MAAASAASAAVAAASIASASVACVSMASASVSRSGLDVFGFGGLGACGLGFDGLGLGGFGFSCLSLGGLGLVVLASAVSVARLCLASGLATSASAASAMATYLCSLGFNAVAALALPIRTNSKLQRRSHAMRKQRLISTVFCRARVSLDGVLNIKRVHFAVLIDR